MRAGIQNFNILISFANMNTNTAGLLGQTMLGAGQPAQRPQGQECISYACHQSFQQPLPHQPQLRLPSANFTDGLGHQAQSSITFSQAEPEGSFEKSKRMYE